MALAEDFDQFDLGGQMIRIVRADAMQLVQQFLRDALGLGKVHAVDHPVSHGLHRFETYLLFQVIDQDRRRGTVIPAIDEAAVRQVGSQIPACQVPAGQADAVHFSRERPPQCAGCFKQRELDARRSSVDG